MSGSEDTMAVLDIIEAPHPILAKKARVVRDEEFGEALVAHLEDMAETMYAAPGVGLAAPQVADSRRILVADPGFEDDDTGQKKKGVELVYMVNPRIVSRSGEITWEESCLSVPDFYIEVKRSNQVTVEFQDGLGEHHSKTFEEFSAVVIQHEMDHLNGVILLDKATGFRRRRYIKRVKKARADFGKRVRA